MIRLSGRVFESRIADRAINGKEWEKVKKKRVGTGRVYRSMGRFVPFNFGEQTLLVESIAEYESAKHGEANFHAVMIAMYRAKNGVRNGSAEAMSVVNVKDLRKIAKVLIEIADQTAMIQQHEKQQIKNRS